MHYFNKKAIKSTLKENLSDYLNDTNYTNQYENIEKLITFLHTVLQITNEKISYILIQNSSSNKKLTEYKAKYHKIQSFDTELLSYLTKNNLAPKLKIIDFYNLFVPLYIDSISNNLPKLLNFLNNERLTLREQKSIILYITNNFTFDEIKQECDNNTSLNKQKLSIILHTIENKQSSFIKNLSNGLITLSGLLFTLFLITYISYVTWNIKFAEFSIGQVIAINSAVTIIPTTTIYFKVFFDFDKQNTTETARIQLVYLKEIIDNSQIKLK